MKHNDKANDMLFIYPNEQTSANMSIYFWIYGDLQRLKLCDYIILRCCTTHNACKIAKLVWYGTEPSVV
jgi:hypothetical protein